MMNSGDYEEWLAEQIIYRRRLKSVRMMNSGNYEEWLAEQIILSEYPERVSLINEEE